jgi:ABC-type multidrug transport system fused ATPase/permease subunit
VPESTPTGVRHLLRAYLRPHRARVAALVAALLLATALPLAGPQLLRRFIDQATSGRPVAALVRTAVLYLVVALGGQVVSVVAAYVASGLAWRTTNRMREDLVDHVLRLDLAYHGRHTPGELIERVDGDVASLGDFLSRFLFSIVGSLLLLVGAVGLVAREDVRIGAALVVFLALAGVVIVRVQQSTVPLATAQREAAAQVIGNLEERLSGAEEIRALGASDHVLNRFQEVSGDAYRATFRWEVRSGGLVVLTSLVFALGAALMLGLGIVGLRNGSLTVGSVVLLFQYTGLVRRPLEQVIQQFKELQKAVAGATRVVQLFGERPTMVDAADARPLPESGPLGMHLDGVSFAYPSDPDEDVLRDVTLRLEPGRSLGLVGRTGSGKTTIARLLLRLYDPPTGAVVLGGVDLRDATAASMRRRVRLVTQDVQLFAADLRDNLTLFARDVADERLVQVLHELGLGEWFQSLPEGLDTVLQPNGGGVSAGEAQLLAFARVFLADPGLVILDEASSRLDPATELLIDRAVSRLLEGRTAVIIAHRLSSLERVDEIAVLEHGQVVEHGDRAALAADASSRFGHLLSVASSGAPA